MSQKAEQRSQMQRPEAEPYKKILLPELTRADENSTRTDKDGRELDNLDKSRQDLTKEPTKTEQKLKYKSN